MRTAAQLREAFAELEFLERKATGLISSAAVEHQLHYLQVLRQTLVVQALLLAEGKPSLKRELSAHIPQRYAQTLAQQAARHQQKETERVLEALGERSPKAAFATAGVQGLLALGAVGYVWWFRSDGNVLIGILVLLLLAGWVCGQWWRTRRYRSRARGVLVALRDQLLVRLKVMQRLHPAL